MTLRPHLSSRLDRTPEEAAAVTADKTRRESRTLAPCGLGFDALPEARWHEQNCAECAKWNNANCRVCGEFEVTLRAGGDYYCESHSPDEPERGSSGE